MKKFAKAALAAALTGVFAGAALAQSAAPSAADAVKARQADYKQVGSAFKAVSDQLKGDKPDLAVIKPATMKLKDLSTALPTWFPPGSGAEAGVKTSAKPEIWSDATGFAAAAKTFADASAKLDLLAQAGDVAGLKDQMKNVGMACGACHTKYRVKEQH